MRDQEIIAQLEAAWDSGFFALASEGRYDATKASGLLALLGTIKLGGVTTLNRRMVALLWYMPLYLEEQVPRIQAARGDLAAYRRTMGAVKDMLEEILGMP